MPVVLFICGLILSPKSIHLRAGRDMIIEHEQMELLLALLGMHGGNQHAAGLNAHHRARRQVDDGQQGLADQLFRLIIGMDAAEDGALLASAVVEGELKQLLALLDSLAGKHLHRAEIGLGEGLKVDGILKQRLDDDLGEVDLLFDNRSGGFGSGRCFLRLRLGFLLLLDLLTADLLHRRENLDISKSG